MADIVERLSKLVILDEVGSNNPLGKDAADEITRLRAELAERTARRDRLADALDFYARYILKRKSDGECMILTPIDHDCGDRAREALVSLKDKP